MSDSQNNSQKISMETIASLLKRRGFVFPSSEIYGGWEAAYDFGPLGAEILRNIRDSWWHRFVHMAENNVGLDGALISHPRVWEASGHVESFNDVMVEDTITHKRYRADHLIEEAIGDKTDGMSPEEINDIIEEKNLLSPDGNKLSEAKRFNILVEAQVGTIADQKTTAYLRGETCQPIFYNFKLVKDSMRLKLPFGIAQIGKAFRNEIKVGPYIFRTREFEQMELEVFVREAEATETYEGLKAKSMDWLRSIGVSGDKLRFRDQEFKERAHYNKVATDLEYEFPFGWKEFQGVHYRGDWDLKRHSEFSGEDLSYRDDETGETFIPHVAEYSIGLNRLLLVLICDAYRQDEKRTYLKLHPQIAPYKAAVFPLVRNKEELTTKARSVFNSLKESGMHVAWDDRGNIGKRYLSQDEIGTPLCITIDYDSLEDDCVTVRNRDTMVQERVKLDTLESYIATFIKNYA
jgi:glycyl-tRNA synthetase